MSEKLLTISVAAYNVEKYLENTLRHLEIPEWLEKLEVYIIDDGGKDGSLSIAQKYKEKYPNTFHAIHKDNGGYGSTVAYSIEHATGKFFKLLDGDDWFDEKGLVKILELLENCSEDVVITDYFVGPDDNSLSIVSCHHNDGDIEHVKDYRTSIPHGMWALFYRTKILKESGIEFPLNTLYTDQLYATIPFAYAEDIRFYQIPVYCYRYGRDEQSTSRKSRIKHIEEMLKVCSALYEFYDQHKEDNNQYLLCRVARYYLGAIRTMLLLPPSTENKRMIVEYENTHQKDYREIYYAAERGTSIAIYIKMLRKTHYRLYWTVKLIPEKYINF